MTRDFKPEFFGVWEGLPDKDGNRTTRIRAAFENETDAHMWQYGWNSANFHIENADGERVVVRGIRERDGRLSHTYTVLASLDEAEREERQRKIEASGLVKGQMVRAIKPARAWGQSGRPAENPPSVLGRIFNLSPDPTRHPVVVEWHSADGETKGRPIYGWFDFADVEKAEP